MTSTRPRRRVQVAADQGDVEVVAQRAHRQRGGRRDRHLELGPVGVRRDALVEQHGRLRCAGSRRTGGPGACRPWPRSASARAAGRRRGTYSRRAWKARSLLAGWSLGTPSRSLIRPGSSARSSVSLGRTSSSSDAGPAAAAAQQAQRVGADVDHRADHGAPRAAAAAPRCVSARSAPRRHERQPHRPGLPRDLEPDRGADQRQPPGRTDGHERGGRFAGGDPVGVEPEPPARGLRQQHQHQRGREQAGPERGDDAELEPAEPAVHRPGQQVTIDDRAADRRDRAGHGTGASAERPGPDRGLRCAAPAAGPPAARVRDGPRVRPGPAVPAPRPSAAG